MTALPNIVLVHGAWADGSSWSAVVERLQADGYTVTAPQFPLNALADNVARLRLVLGRQDGPTVVAGHSYGGQIITALGTDAPNVVGLVYIAAFGLDEGESIGALLDGGPPPPAVAHLSVDAENFVSKRKVHSSSAYLVFVALDEEGKPRPVPPIVAETDELQQRQREAKLRRENRLARKAAIISLKSAWCVIQGRVSIWPSSINRIIRVKSGGRALRDASSVSARR